MKLRKFIFIGFVLILVTSNVYDYFKIGISYDYSTANGNFTHRCRPSKGSTVARMEERLELYKFEKGRSLNDTILYRTSKKNWTHIGKWRSYIWDDVWQYPYLESE